MVAAVAINETRTGVLLARLAALAVARVEHLQDRMFAAEDDAVAVDLANAATKAERSARQTLALEAKLDQDIARAVREQETHERGFRPERERLHKEAVIRRREDLRTRLERIAWDEFESPETVQDFLDEVLYEELQEQSGLATFLEEPFEAQLARIQRGLGLGLAGEPEPPSDQTAAPERTFNAAEPDALNGEAVLPPPATTDAPDSS